MELIRMADLYTVRHAIVEGRVNSLSLSYIDAVIEEATLHDFVDGATRERIEGVLRGINGQATGSRSTLH